MFFLLFLKNTDIIFRQRECLSRKSNAKLSKKIKISSDEIANLMKFIMVLFKYKDFLESKYVYYFINEEQLYIILRIL